MTGTRTRSLVEAVLLAVLSVLLVLAGSWVPVVGLFGLLFSPLPTLVATVRLGPRLGLASATVASLVVLLVAGPLGAVATWLDLVAFGAGMGWAWQSRRDPLWVIGAGALGMVVTTLATLTISRLFLGQDLLAQLTQQMLRSAEEAGALLKASGGMQAGQVEEATRQLSQQLHLLMGELLPGVVLAAGAGYALLLVAVAGPLARRLDLPPLTLPPFAGWDLPTWTVGLWGIGFVLSLASERLAGGLLRSTGANLVLIGQMLFLVEGTAFAYFWLRRWHLAKGLAVLILVILLVNPYFSQVLVWLGLFESIVHMRRSTGVS